MTVPSGSLLVVDDNEVNRDMLSRRLQRKGYAVTLAEDGKRALELIGQHGYDLVLLDIKMPGISGLEVLKTLRVTHSATKLPVIMATAMDDSSDVVEALNLGANDYVTKPLDFPVVVARVETQLAVKRAVDQIKALEENLAQRNQELEKVVSALEAANDQLATANHRMHRDLKAAARIQEALLPAVLPKDAGANFAWLFKPCAELAGDLLNVFPLDDQHVGMYVLDVVGHGVAAALLSVTVSRLLSPTAEAWSFLRRQAPVDGSRLVPPTEVAKRLNEHFPWDPNTQQFFTLFYGILDLPSAEWRFVSAGHPPPIYVAHEAKTAVTLTGFEGFPIGLSENGYQEQVVSLRPGDRVFLYSDGLSDAMNGAGDQFGTQRLLGMLTENRGMPLAESLATLWQSVEAWCEGERPHDDVSLLALEIARRPA